MAVIIELVSIIYFLLFVKSKINSVLGTAYVNWKSTHSRNKKWSQQICDAKRNGAPREITRRRKEGMYHCLFFNVYVNL